MSNAASTGFVHGGDEPERGGPPVAVSRQSQRTSAVAPRSRKCSSLSWNSFPTTGSNSRAQDESPPETSAPASINDIIVTAQRVEQRLQDVPISMTILQQETVTNNNISNMKGLATFTLGLQVNNRFGADSTNFSVRGFTQEQRTTATVGVYFADVVAPRGSGAPSAAKGAGPGALFDLQNVQVLKEP